MVERRGDPAQRSEPGGGKVGDPAVAADHHHRIDMRGQLRADQIDQPRTVEQRDGLVAAETTGLPAGQDRAEDQALRSTRTGTDFAAGTWLWWA